MFQMQILRNNPTSGKILRVKNWQKGEFVLKGEIQSRFKLIQLKEWNISNRTLKFDVNRIKNKEDMKLWIIVFNFHQSISWTVDMNMQIGELMISSPHNFPCILYIKVWNLSFFVAQTCKSMSSSQNMSEQITLFCIHSEFYFLIAEIRDFRHFCEQNTYLWGDDIIPLICIIHFDCSRNVSMKITEILNSISSLFCIQFTSIFTVLFKYFNSFHWFNLTWTAFPF